MTFNRLISGICDRELALIFTSHPPADAEEALQLDATRRTQFPLTLEPRSGIPANTWGEPPVLQGPVRPPYANPTFHRQPQRP
ncbi:unnamed protein product [Dibothriocephalus latus]|uniref:Uncharacterized protein n=1 Tax=Dibothriocephalus latus TaxID=60516 RepID=A0A3P7LCK8_DIBLA|nr:unnamed protein product [Dibothriocephalus latus]